MLVKLNNDIVDVQDKAFVSNPEISELKSTLVADVFVKTVVGSRLPVIRELPLNQAMQIADFIDIQMGDIRSKLNSDQEDIPLYDTILDLRNIQSMALSPKWEYSLVCVFKKQQLNFYEDLASDKGEYMLRKVKNQCKDIENLAVVTLEKLDNGSPFGKLELTARPVMGKPLTDDGKAFICAVVDEIADYFVRQGLLEEGVTDSINIL